jgi:hypothetical protein
VGKYYRIGAAAVAWFALVLQYYLTITKAGAPFIEATVRATSASSPSSPTSLLRSL